MPYGSQPMRVHTSMLLFVPSYTLFNHAIIYNREFAQEDLGGG